MYYKNVPKALFLQREKKKNKAICAPKQVFLLVWKNIAWK